MDNCCYPNLFIIEEDAVTRMATTRLQHSIIATGPRQAIANINIYDVQVAIQLQFHTVIDIYQISAHGSHFIVHAPSPEVHTLMLAAGQLTILAANLSLKPWSIEYGSTKIPTDVQLTRLHHVNHNDVARNMQKPPTPIQIIITDISAHLCNDHTIELIVHRLCHVQRITFIPSNYKYNVTTTTHCFDMIPQAVQLGFRKTKPQHPFLHIWPLHLDTFDTTTEDDMHIELQKEEATATSGHISCDEMFEESYNDYDQQNSPNSSTGYLSGCSHHTECMCRYQQTDSGSSDDAASMDTDLSDREPRY